MAYRCQSIFLMNIIMKIKSLPTTLACLFFFLFNLNSYAADFSADQSDQIFKPEEKQLNAKKINKIDSENFEAGLFYGLLGIEDFGSNTQFGARLAYRANEIFYLEARYGQSKAGLTSFERLSGNIQLLTDVQRDFTYYDISLGADIFPGENFIANRTINSSFYIVGGIGSTNFAGNTQFTYNFGAGLRLLPTDWINVYIEGRDHVMDRNILGFNQTTHNLSFISGFSFFF